MTKLTIWLTIHQEHMQWDSEEPPFKLIIFMSQHNQSVQLYLCVLRQELYTKNSIRTSPQKDSWLCFIYIRWPPRTLFSGNGSNCIRAKSELEEVQMMLNHSQSITHTLSHFGYTDKTIQNHLTPPRVPHFGWLWEAGIHAMKILLKKQLKPHALTWRTIYNPNRCGSYTQF